MAGLGPRDPAPNDRTLGFHRRTTFAQGWQVDAVATIALVDGNPAENQAFTCLREVGRGVFLDRSDREETHVQKGPGLADDEPLSLDGHEDAIRVLLVEDDDDFRETLGWQLAERGFSVQGFSDGAHLLAALHELAAADLVILDWILPSVSGIDLLAQLRGSGCTLPVVFLTGHSLTDREALALQSGAVDFVDKARGIDILVSRLKRLVKRAPVARTPKPEEPLVCGRLVLRSAVSRAFWRDHDVGLTVGEYKIVHLLASNAGRDVSYRSIYDCLHYEGFIAGAGNTGFRMNVRSVIRHIRGKFKRRDPAFDEIVNQSALGYRWRPPESEA